MEKFRSPLLIVIPVYNEEKTILHVIQDIEKNCPDFDYLIVNDGSSDGTLEICRERQLNVLNLPVNLGLAGAFQAGVRYAVYNGYQYVIQFDGDGQHCAEFISPMLQCAIEEKYNIVIASRYLNRRKGRSFREIGSRLISGCIFVSTGKRIKDPTSGMRLYDFSTMVKIGMCVNYSPEPDTIALLLKQGSSIKEIPAVMKERLHGVSYLKLSNAIKYMFYECVSILIVNHLR